MNLLDGKLYDPAVAVTKATTALLALTAIDTANLRLSFNVPPSGKVKVVVRGGVLHGAATYPVILLGVLNVAVVVARVTPNVTLAGVAAATTPAQLEAEFIVTGLVPGTAVNWDLAYGVEQVVALTGLKYGGPNNATTAGDAFGGISFEAWDPQPQVVGTQLAVDANGRVDVSKVVGTAQTARDLGAQLDVASSTRAPAATAVSTVDLTPARAAKLDNVDVATSTRAAAATAVSNVDLTPARAANLDAAISTRAPAATAVSTADLTPARAAKLDNLDVASSTRLATAGYTAPDNAGIATTNARLTAVRAAALDNLDAAVSTRLAAVGYTAPDNASVAAIKARTDNLPPDPADASDIAAAFGTVNASLATVASYVDTEVGAIKAKTDQLSFTAGKVDANLQSIRGAVLTGDGGAVPFGV